MFWSAASLAGLPIERGTYSPSKKSDIRSPCPLINCLANHGYISRDGRHVRPEELLKALKEVGISTGLRSFLAKPIFLERKNARSKIEHSLVNEKKRSSNSSVLQYFWYIIRYVCYLLANPWALVFSSFGMREPGQANGVGHLYLNLDQLALPGAIEHDISLTRHDISQGDNLTPQKDLINALLNMSSDGGKTLSIKDIAARRRQRIEEREKANSHLNYGLAQHQGGCAEIALLLHVFGDGTQIRSDFASAVFKEERLPYREGWSKRRWWTLGFVELGMGVFSVWRLVGTPIPIDNALVKLLGL